MNWDGFKELTGGEFDTPWSDDIIVSQSTMKELMYSPSRYGLRKQARAMGLADPPPSGDMFFGTLVHAAIDQYVEGDLSTIDATWVEALAANPPHPDDDGFNLWDVFPLDMVELWVDEINHAVDEWVTYWWDVEGQFIDLIQHEERIHRQLGTLPDGRRVFVAGTPDYVGYKFGAPTGWDWKTSKGPWTWAKAAGSPQAPILTWLLEPITGTLYMDWEFLVWDRKGKAWETWALDGAFGMTPEFVGATIMNAWQWARAIAYDVYPAVTMVTAGFQKSVRPWYAKPEYNPYWEIDPFRHYLDDIDDTRGDT